VGANFPEANFPRGELWGGGRIVGGANFPDPVTGIPGVLITFPKPTFFTQLYNLSLQYFDLG